MNTINNIIYIFRLILKTRYFVQLVVGTRRRIAAGSIPMPQFWGDFVSLRTEVGESHSKFIVMTTAWETVQKYVASSVYIIYIYLNIYIYIYL